LFRMIVADRVKSPSVSGRLTESTPWSVPPGAIVGVDTIHDEH
jgi:hypothetical protein